MLVEQPLATPDLLVNKLVMKLFVEQPDSPGFIKIEGGISSASDLLFVLLGFINFLPDINLKNFIFPRRNRQMNIQKVPQICG